MIRLIAIGFLPGIIAYIIGLIVPDQFIVYMAPDRFPAALATKVTQIWIASVGLALALVGAFYEGKEWVQKWRAVHG